MPLLCFSFWRKDPAERVFLERGYIVTRRCVNAVMWAWRKAVLSILLGELPRGAVDFDRQASCRDAEVSTCKC